MLYLNLVFISKRHWSSSQQTNMGLQFVVRTVSLVAILISLNALVSYRARRIDMTAESLYTLSDTTRDSIDEVDDKRPVTIQAFLSPDVPREYVPGPQTADRAAEAVRSSRRGADRRALRRRQAVQQAGR